MFMFLFLKYILFFVFVFLFYMFMFSFCLFFVPFNEKLSKSMVFHKFRKFLSKFQTHPNQCEFHKTYENPMDFATLNLHVQHGIKCVENKIQ